MQRKARFVCVSFEKTYAVYPYALKVTVALARHRENCRVRRDAMTEKERRI